MATLDDAFARLRSLNQLATRPLTLPTEADVAGAEVAAGVPVPPSLRRYFLEASDVVVGTHEPVTLGNPGSHRSFETVLADARSVGVPSDLVPFCEDNGNYFCMEASGGVLYWDHNGVTDESWPGLAEWIQAVWLGDEHAA